MKKTQTNNIDNVIIDNNANLINNQHASINMQNNYFNNTIEAKNKLIKKLKKDFYFARHSSISYITILLIISFITITGAAIYFANSNTRLDDLLISNLLIIVILIVYFFSNQMFYQDANISKFKNEEKTTILIVKDIVVFSLIFYILS